MSAISWSSVVAHFGALANVDPAAQVDILEYVNANVNVALLGGEASYKTKMARIYLAAHFGQITLAGASGTSGNVQSETFGAESITLTYSDNVTAEALELTAPGQQYRSLLRRSAARVGFVPGGC